MDEFSTSPEFEEKLRQALGVRTVFNILGPLTNPAGATRQLLGEAAKVFCSSTN